MLKLIFFSMMCLLAAFAALAQQPGTGVPIDGPEKKDDPQKEQTSGLTGTLIVLNKAEASASLIDLASGREIKRIAVGEGPHEVAVSPDGATAVVCNYGAQTPGGTLTVLDLKTLAPKKTIDLGEYRRPHGIAFLPDQNKVIVTVEHNQAVVIVNLESGQVEQSISTDAAVSHMLALSPDGKRAYVANIGSHSMTALDLEFGEKVTEIPTGRQAEGIDVSPDGTEIWVSNRANHTISVIDAQTLEIAQTIESESFPIRVKFTPDGDRVLVSNAQSGDVAIFDAASKEEIKRIPMNEEPRDDETSRMFQGQFEGSPVPIGILILPSGTHAFIANTSADIVTVLDLRTLSVAGRIEAGKEPDGLGYSPLTLGTAQVPPKPSGGTP